MLIILGLIVVLGAAFLIYYQLGPKVTLRLKSGLGMFGGFGGPADEDAEAGAAQGPMGAAFEGRAEGFSEPAGDKVLYVFGNGAREERSLREDDEQGKGE